MVREGKRMTLAQAAGILNTKRCFNVALTLACVNMKSPIADVMRLFPELFDVEANFVRARPPVIPGCQRLRRAI